MGVKFATCVCGACVSGACSSCPVCGIAMATSQQKYRNQKTRAVVGGEERTFDSRGESSRAKALEMMQRAGEISELKLQPRFSLVPETSPPIVYVPDFQYRENGQVIVEDFKSPATRRDPVFCLKLRLWRWRGPYPLKLTQMKRGGDLHVEMIPKGISVS